jgi:hypothetical protein
VLFQPKLHQANSDCTKAKAVLFQPQLHQGILTQQRFCIFSLALAHTAIYGRGFLTVCDARATAFEQALMQRYFSAQRSFARG